LIQAAKEDALATKPEIGLYKSSNNLKQKENEKYGKVDFKTLFSLFDGLKKKRCKLFNKNIKLNFI
jgi:hypothetical protein